MLRRRLSASARELLAGDVKIGDLALAYQFNNPETYSRAFKRMFGLLPSQAGNAAHLGRLLFKPQVGLDYLYHINQGEYLKPKRQSLSALHLAGLASYDAADEHPTSSLQRLWEVYHVLPVPASLPSPPSPGIDPASICALRLYPAGQPGCTCLVGQAVPTLGDVPASLVGKHLTARSYARFIHHGQLDRLDYSLDYIYQTWLPRSGEWLPLSGAALQDKKQIGSGTHYELYTFAAGYQPQDPGAECAIWIPLGEPQPASKRYDGKVGM
jgi:AraC family transcriptional regulator